MLKRNGMKRIAAAATLLSALMLSASATFAQGHDAKSKPVNPDSTRIIFLGTKGGPMLGTQRMQNAVMLVVDGEPYLVDAGAGVAYQSKRAGITPKAVHNIFISHNHMDHNAGLAAFMAESWIFGAQKRNDLQVTIHGPADTRGVFEGLMQYLGVVARISNNKGDIGNGHLMMPPQVFTLQTFDEDGVIYDDNGVTVTQVENTHYQFPPDTPAFDAGDESVSYRFDTPHGSVCYTGDTGPSAKVDQLFQGCDVLISEVIDLDAVQRKIMAHGVSGAMLKGLMAHMKKEHLTPENIGRMASKANIKTVFLYHIVPTADAYTDATEFTAGVAKHFDGTILLSQDLMEYDLY